VLWRGQKGGRKREKDRKKEKENERTRERDRHACAANAGCWPHPVLIDAIAASALPPPSTCEWLVSVRQAVVLLILLFWLEGKAFMRKYMHWYEGAKAKVKHMMYRSAFVCLCVSLCVFMCVCVYVCVRVCVCLCVCWERDSLYVHARTIYARTNIYTCTVTQTHTMTHAHTCNYNGAYIRSNLYWHWLFFLEHFWIFRLIHLMMS